MSARLKCVISVLLALTFTLLHTACGEDNGALVIESEDFLYASVTSVDGGGGTTATTKVGIAWKDNKASVYKAAEDSISYAGGEATVLPQVLDYDLEYESGKLAGSMTDSHGILTSEAAELVKTNTYKNSNVKEALSGVSCVVFIGGEDISPSLYKNPQGWHGIEAETKYNATRDVSDYLLMSYCLDNDIPMLCICRGMQMLAVVSGGSLIQDIETYYKEQGATYNYEHRFPSGTEDKDKSYIPHSVDVVDESSIAHSLFGNKLDDAPSWHHQAVAYSGNEVCEELTVTGTSTISEVTIAEVIERTDKTFALGVQFHPEIVIEKMLKGSEDADSFYDVSISEKIFASLIDSIK